jgi:mRNA interferase RelE/StbE
MPFGIYYHPDVKKVDLSRINRRSRSRIRTVIEGELVNQPEAYGRTLRRTLKGYWKLRVGDYRVVYRISRKDVLIQGIIHREDVYKRVGKRTTTDD